MSMLAPLIGNQNPVMISKAATGIQIAAGDAGVGGLAQGGLHRHPHEDDERTEHAEKGKRHWNQP